MASLLDLAEARLRGLLDIPTRAARAIVNPTAFSGLLGGPTLPKEQGFAEAAFGLPARENMSVLDPTAASYMQGYSAGEPMAYLGMATPFAAPAAVAGAKAVAPKAGMALENYMAAQGLLQPLTAYHGTPHNIQGKFDISKVGTGEGAQAYGHGMYFAESPAVAKTYIKAGDEGFKANAAEYAIQQYGGIDQAIQKLTEKLKNPDEYKWVKENTQTVLDGLNKLKKGEQIGNLYKVDIPDEYIPNMLDWDKPLSEQPKVVQNAFKSILNKEVSPQGLDIGGAKILDNRNRQTDPTQSKPWVMQSGDKYFGLDQKDVDQLISNETAKGLYGRLAADLGSQQAASEFLLNQGVKGIRYLDQASRGKSGTSNFVVFEPSEVKILEKNKKKIEGLLD